MSIPAGDPPAQMILNASLRNEGLIMARIVRELPSEFANVAAYLARLKQRPSYARAWA